VTFSTPTGDVTSLRFCIAFFGLGERYGDTTSIDVPREQRMFTERRILTASRSKTLN